MENQGSPVKRAGKALLVGLEKDRGLPIRDALGTAGYQLLLAAGPLDAARQLREKSFDVLVISTLLGGPALESLRNEIKSLGAPPPVLVVGDLPGKERWEHWRLPSQRLHLREPFDLDDVLRAVATLTTAGPER